MFTQNTGARMLTGVNRKVGLALCLLAIALLGVPAPTAHAGIITVMSYTDGAVNAANCPGVNCRLRDAIAAANANDSITFSSAGHTIALTQGELNLNKNLTIFFIGDVGDIIIDAQSGSRAFNVASGTTATLDTLFIENGGPAAGFNGGAIRVASTATLNLNNISIVNSQVMGSGDVGGAIYNLGTLNITNFAFFSGNHTASGGQGGGIYNAGTATLNGSVYSGGTRSIWFFGNGTNAALEGGTIYNNGTMTVTNITINNSIAKSGGAIANYATLTMQQSLIVGNHANGTLAGQGEGGGILNAAASTLIVGDSSISTNTAENAGGGITTHGGLAMYRSFLANKAVNAVGAFGGGIATALGSAMVIVNSTFSSNSAPLDGGGIFNALGSVADFNNVTISKNTADDDNDGDGNGGGMYNGCPTNHLCISRPMTVTLSNSILSGDFDTPNNGGSGAIDPECAGLPLTSQGYNLIFNTAGCTVNGNSTGNILGQPALLAPLADNGGWTPTHALLPLSPAINAGNPAPPGSGGNACATLDQRAYPRGGAAGRCDMGAYERVFLLFLPLISRQ